MLLNVSRYSRDQGNLDRAASRARFRFHRVTR